MKTLVIDSHKSSATSIPQNLHWINAKQIADNLGADLIWSYPEVNDNIKSDYDRIIFVHASRYSFEDHAWLEQSPNAELFFVTNEYNLGEPYVLWKAIKRMGRKYTVIANHPSKPSKVVMKYVKDWHIVNLNALCYNEDREHIEMERNGCVYYGSFRKGRSKYYQKYLDGNKIITSTHSKNHQKYNDLEIEPNFIPRVNWKKNGLYPYQATLYIEDEITHTYYNNLANRFYESLMYDCPILFDKTCIGTIKNSHYDIGDEFIVDSPDDVLEKLKNMPKIPFHWKDIALQEKEICLRQVMDIIRNG
jgi:hypothetical protein